MLSERFDGALAYASGLHRQQMRKGTDIPNVSHLFAVAGLVIEAGGSENESIAALLHDAVEDQGGALVLGEIRRKFGDEVAQIVNGCSDTDHEPKPPWRKRKEDYIAQHDAVGAENAHHLDETLPRPIVAGPGRDER